MTPIVFLRSAHPGDSEVLSALALRSKGHWGYDAKFLAACRDELTMTPERLAALHVVVAELDGRIAGFGSLGISGRRGEIRDLFVEPDAIGRGVGRAIMAELRRVARAVGVVRITVDSDPNAIGFYETQGFVRIGDAISQSIPGRTLPKLELEL